MTLKDWEEIIEKMGEGKAKKCENAIAELRDWDEFKEHFGWTGIFALGVSLKHKGRGVFSENMARDDGR